jgi:uncharacterized protein
MAIQDKPSRLCPICGKPSDPGRPPFCSPRCADVDLNRWLKGAYAIPVVEADDTEEDEGDSDSGFRH